jgi:hypothetical protein
MAGFNEILIGRFNRMLQKLLSMKGGAVMSTLSGELVPSIVVFHGVEDRALESWDRFGLFLTITAGAATNSLLRLRNPSASGAVVVIEKIALANNTAANQFYQIRHGSGDASDAAVVNVTAQGATRWDPRSKPGTVLVVSSNAGAVVSPPSPGATKDIAAVPIGNTYAFINDENQEMLIFPGDSLDVFMNNAAVALDVAWTWRERALEDSEKK